MNSFEFNNLRHGRACPGHPRPARILLIGWHSAFFRILLVLPSWRDLGNARVLGMDRDRSPPTVLYLVYFGGQGASA
jgi:hypothetical protein